MARWQFFSRYLIAMALTASVAQAAPPAKNGGSEDLKKAQEILQEDFKQLSEAHKTLMQAQGNLKTANQNLAVAKEKAEAAQEREVGLESLMAEQKAARREFKDASDPVLAELRKSDTWAAAKKRVDGAKNRPGAKASDIAQDAMAVTLLERETIENDAKLKPLRDKSHAADKAVTEARAKIRAAIPEANEVKTAELEVEKYKGELKKSQMFVGQLLQKAGYDQAVANREAQEAQLMQLMQRSRQGGKGGGKGRK